MFKKPSLDTSILESLSVKPHNELGEDYAVMSRVPLTAFVAEEGLGESSLYLELFENEEEIEVCERFAIVDCETTGLDSKSDEIIEIGILKGFYNPISKRIVSLDEFYCYLEQPSKPIAPIITEVTGLTDDALKGQRIDDDAIERAMKNVSLVIAHNAKFDRGLIDNHRIGKFFKGKTWACSAKGGDIDWSAAGHRSSALGSLLADYGFFFDAHRASVDCAATAWLLLIAQPQFAQLLGNATQDSFDVHAYGAPFSVKDTLKARGYRWNAQEKVWELHNLIGAEKAKEEIKWLSTLYPQALALGELTMKPATERHT